MTQLPSVFDPNQHNPQGPPQGNLPVSDKHGHIVTIVDSEMKETADRTGTMLVLTLEIQQGEHQGQTGPYRLNIGNTSQDAVRIALSQLSAICHVIGYLQPLQDISVLYNKPFRVVVQQQNSEEGRTKGYTEVKGVLDINGNKPGKSGATAPAASPGPAPGAAPAPGQMPPPPAAPQPQGPPQQAFPQQQAQQAQQPPQGFPQQQQQPQQPPQQQFQQPQGPPQMQQQPFPQQQQQPQPPQQFAQQQPNPGAAPWNQAPQQ